MPRPKPPEPLKHRYIRMSDTDWAKFKMLGGADWLRKYLGGIPNGYYEVFQKQDEETESAT